MARHLTLVSAPADPRALLPHLRAALEGTAPLAVLPAGPPAAVDAARTLLRPQEPLEPGADLVVVTSGSTGGGRGVLLPASAVVASAEATMRRLGGPGAWLLVLPVSSVAGLQVLCRSVVARTEPTVPARGEGLAAAVARMPPGRRYAAMVPTQLRRFLEAEAGGLRALDAVLVGGAATDPALLARARDEGVTVATSYGMTETAGGCVYDGRPLDGVRVRVTEGGVELAGPVLALGYRLDPEGTAAAFADGWFRTRDAGSLGPDGRLTVHGRLDDVVITGGVNVAPQAVEAVLREHPAVADAVVFGRHDEEWGQRVVAAVVPVPGAEPDLDVLRPWVRERLGGPAAPRELHRIAAVPTLHTGKPDRRGLAARITAAPAADERH
ncbi:o-succinylbenzoate--CoA ligase [Geodermatophilus sabuli]|uniref:O-succinylbenzoic acid--CoA ligase n=1 Tax=Geodermatophilus sabuli TaxID=1564158 RepID=A0A285E9R0_9ACTN|nr:o-succinylbenzoate--CoA ligase [Geodermatophilus sabuli]MBB3084979.1 O-succinylbenzoic acid--CoA ligase [Geodermatophilus sabuli]SNX95613.1 O-succinylbenzoic acid--CoA ligase [Geodermatophilus sabuli]